MNEQTLKIGDYTLHFYPCEDKKRPVFYLQMDDERAQEIASQMAGHVRLYASKERTGTAIFPLGRQKRSSGRGRILQAAGRNIWKF